MFNDLPQKLLLVEPWALVFWEGSNMHLGLQNHRFMVFIDELDHTEII